VSWIWALGKVFIFYFFLLPFQEKYFFTLPSVLDLGNRQSFYFLLIFFSFFPRKNIFLLCRVS